MRSGIINEDFAVANRPEILALTVVNDTGQQSPGWCSQVLCSCKSY